jgi:hypothetical protein
MSVGDISNPAVVMDVLFFNKGEVNFKGEFY